MRTKYVIIIETFLLNQEKTSFEIVDYTTTHCASILDNNVWNEKQICLICESVLHLMLQSIYYHIMIRSNWDGEGSSGPCSCIT